MGKDSVAFCLVVAVVVTFVAGLWSLRHSYAWKLQSDANHAQAAKLQTWAPWAPMLLFARFWCLALLAAPCVLVTAGARLMARFRLLVRIRSLCVALPKPGLAFYLTVWSLQRLLRGIELRLPFSAHVLWFVRKVEMCISARWVFAALGAWEGAGSVHCIYQ